MGTALILVKNGKAVHGNPWKHMYKYGCKQTISVPRRKLLLEEESVWHWNWFECIWQEIFSPSCKTSITCINTCDFLFNYMIKIMEERICCHKRNSCQNNPIWQEQKSWQLLSHEPKEQIFIFFLLPDFWHTAWEIQNLYL